MAGIQAAAYILASALLSSQPADIPHSDMGGYYAIATARELATAGIKQMSTAQLNDFIVAHLAPWAKMKMEATDGVADDTGALCLPDGIFRYPNVAGRFLWIPAPDKVILAFGN